MILLIPDVLDKPTREAIVSSLAGAEFVDGRLTGGAEASRIKRNLQLPPGSALADAAGAAVARALLANAAFIHAARPRTVLRAQVNRYDAGMGYGLHLDNPIHAGQATVRADVSVTLFLNDASEYDGGELVVHSDGGLQHFRASAGAALVYPSSCLHEVLPVTRGTRLVAITWVQSLVRDPRARRILHDLSTAIEALAASDPERQEIRRLRHVHDNLLRMWAET